MIWYTEKLVFFTIGTSLLGAVKVESIFEHRGATEHRRLRLSSVPPKKVDSGYHIHHLDLLRRLKPKNKVDVCHLDDEGTYIHLNIATQAVNAHLDHGDSMLGDAYPGSDYAKFGPDCDPICAFESGDNVPDAEYHVFDENCNPICGYSVGEEVPDQPYHIFNGNCYPVCGYSLGEEVPDQPYHIFNEICHPVCGYSVEDEVPDQPYHVFDTDCAPTCKYEAGAGVPDLPHHVFDTDCAPTCKYEAGAGVPDLPHHVFDTDCAPTCKYEAGEYIPEFPYHVFDNDCTPVCGYAEGESVPDIPYNVFGADCSPRCNYEEGDEVPGLQYHIFDSDCTPVCGYAENELVPELQYHVFDATCNPYQYFYPAYSTDDISVLSCDQNTVKVDGALIDTIEVGSFLIVNPKKPCYLSESYCTDCAPLYRRVTSIDASEGSSKVLTTLFLKASDVFDQTDSDPAFVDFELEPFFDCVHSGGTQHRDSESCNNVLQPSEESGGRQLGVCDRDWLAISPSGRCRFTNCYSRYGEGCFYCGRSCDNGCGAEGGTEIPDWVTWAATGVDLGEICCHHDHCFASTYPRYYCDRQLYDDWMDECLDWKKWVLAIIIGPKRAIRTIACPFAAEAGYKLLSAMSKDPYESAQRLQREYERSQYCQAICPIYLKGDVGVPSDLSYSLNTGYTEGIIGLNFRASEKGGDTIIVTYEGHELLNEEAPGEYNVPYTGSSFIVDIQVIAGLSPAEYVESCKFNTLTAQFDCPPGYPGYPWELAITCRERPYTIDCTHLSPYPEFTGYLSQPHPQSYILDAGFTKGRVLVDFTSTVDGDTVIVEYPFENGQELLRQSESGSYEVEYEGEIDRVKLSVIPGLNFFDVTDEDGICPWDITQEQWQCPGVTWRLDVQCIPDLCPGIPNGQCRCSMDPSTPCLPEHDGFRAPDERLYICKDEVGAISYGQCALYCSPDYGLFDEDTIQGEPVEACVLPPNVCTCEYNEAAIYCTESDGSPGVRICDATMGYRCKLNGPDSSLTTCSAITPETSCCYES